MEEGRRRRSEMSARGFGDFDVDLPFDSGDVVVVWVQVRM